MSSNIQNFGCFSRPTCPTSSVTPMLTAPGCGVGCCEDSCLPCLPMCDKPIFRECVSRPCGTRRCLDPSYPNMPVPPRNPPRCQQYNGFLPGEDPNYCIDDHGGCHHKAACFDDYNDGKEHQRNCRSRPECCDLNRSCSRKRQDPDDCCPSRCKEKRCCHEDEGCHRKSSPTECCHTRSQPTPTKTNYVMPCYRYEDGRIEQFVPVIHGQLPKTVFMRNGTQDHVNGYRGALRVMCAGCTDDCLPPCVYTVIEPLKTYYRHITDEKLPTTKKDRDFCQNFIK